MTVERDRDALGRARNARPRDGLGRPLPRGSGAGSERVPDELHMSVDDTVALAQSYLDSGRPFHAHEVLEALWKTRPASERDLWQGLAQIAVGFTHAMRGNTVGGATLLRRGAGRVANYVGDTHGIDIVGVLVWAEDLAAAPIADPPRLTLRG
ncbi:MAG TPA: DUF309 domain-containing protein [Acidothermaceae bacterium]|jgi:hypothetical protein